MTTHLHADGTYAKELWMPGPGSAFGEKRVDQAMLLEGLQYPQMNGRLVFTHAVTRMPQVLIEACTKAQHPVKDLDMVFFHQANMRINDKVAEILEIPSEKVHSTIQKFGNTTAATIPLGMFDAYQEGKLKPGMLIGLAAFGAGFTWSSSILRF
ncbi:3-oxoacyl-[acyl-carrier-protein] synthase 3 [compost metagenome]